MKFLDQVNAYQRVLSKKSRFFSSIMLISGIGLAVAAPFLSYEVSKLECHEKGTVPSKIGDDEMVILKNDWKRRDQKIVDLEDAIQKKDEKIKAIINDANCDEVIRVIDAEKEELEVTKIRLEKEVIEVEKERDDCRKQLKGCEEEKEIMNNQGSECDKLQSEIERWEKRYKQCEEDKGDLLIGMNDCREVEEENDKLTKERDGLLIQVKTCRNELSNQGSTDCNKVEEELKICKEQLAENKEIITKLKGELRTSIATSKLNISGTFHYDETFTINNDDFVIIKNLGDDPMFGYLLVHNGKDVSTRMEGLNGAISYAYTSRKKKYIINFGIEGKRSVKFKLSAL